MNIENHLLLLVDNTIRGVGKHMYTYTVCKRNATHTFDYNTRVCSRLTSFSV